LFDIAATKIGKYREGDFNLTEIYSSNVITFNFL